MYFHEEGSLEFPSCPVTTMTATQPSRPISISLLHQQPRPHFYRKWSPGVRWLSAEETIVYLRLELTKHLFCSKTMWSNVTTSSSHNKCKNNLSFD